MAKDMIHPPALNKSGPKHLFHSRKEYKFRALSDVEERHKRRFQDFWYENDIFGKVDGHGNAIFPMSAGMSTLTANEPHFAMDFVKDAYHALLNHYEHALSKRRMKGLLGVINDMVPKRAYEDPRGLFQRHLDGMKSFFLESYLYKFSDQIVNFSDYLRFYELLILNHAEDFPMTLTAFILSSQCPMRASGLIVEIAEAKHDKDKEKNDILNSRDFRKYLSMATRFGFQVDKNAPWTLVADLSSPAMHKFMEKYCIDANPKNIFSAFYYPSYLKDLDLMKEFMLDCYYTLMTNRPYITERKICKGKLLKRAILRNVLMPEEIDKEVSNDRWLEIYMRTRLAECGKKNLDPAEFQSVLEKSLIIYNKIGPDHGLRYVNDYLKKADPRTENFQKIPGSPPAGHTGPIPPVPEGPSGITIGQTADYLKAAVERGALTIMTDADVAERHRLAQEYVAMREAEHSRYPALYTETARARDAFIGQFQAENAQLARREEPDAPAQSPEPNVFV